MMEELSWRYFAEFFKRCDLTLVPSKYAQEECRKHGFSTEILPNGIDFRKFQSIKDPTPFNQKWNLEPKDLVAIYVGRLSEEKNIDLILESANEVLKTTDHLKYMIVGDGPHRSRLEKLVETYKIADSVIFTGYLHQEMLNEAYSRANFFINASPLETQGLSVIEAMYFGCPILSIDSGAVTDLFSEKLIGDLFQDAADLTEHTKKLVSQPKLRASLGKNAQIKAQDYDIKNFCHQLLAIYETQLKQ